MSIVFNFKNKRKNKRISQQSLALQIGISQSYLNQIENNTYKRSPSVALIERIAEILDSGCFLDIIECDNSKGCKNCRHIQYLHNDEDIHYYI